MLSKENEMEIEDLELKSKNSGSEALSCYETLVNLLDVSEISQISQVQLDAIKNLEKADAMLINFNKYSEDMYKSIASDFESQTRMYKHLKQDLDQTYRRIKRLKKKAYELKQSSLVP